MIFALKCGRDLVFESVEVINRQSALLASAQMIDDHLKLLSRQVSINISGYLFRR